MNWIPVLAAGASATLLCGLWWRGTRGRLLDIPGDRSLHARPTPTGGGIGIVAALLVGVSVSTTDAAAPAAGLLLPAGLLCLAGLLDDFRGLGVWPRLALQGSCAAWVVLALLPVPPSPVLLALTGLWLVGFTNIFNFMDGIDGLAASQATFAGFAGAWLLGGQGDLALMLALTGAGTAGFLLWNWPPAKMFMGDAGSLPLGFLLAALALFSAVESRLPAWCWPILFAPLLCDAGITLLLRAWARKPLLRAHREHAYQRLAAHGHRPVTLGLVVVDLVWLLPWAWLAAHRPSLAPVAAASAMLPLCVLVGVVAWRHRAGETVP